MSQAELERVTAEIQKDIEALRGVSFPGPVKVAVTDREGFLAYARKRLELSTSPERIAAEELSAKLLGLVPPELDMLALQLKVLEEQVAGFYDPASDSFYLMGSFDPRFARVILAHELTHALDDQLFGIDGAMEQRLDNTDALLAYQAVVEGSGTALMTAWSVQQFKDKKLSLADLANTPGMDSPSLRECPEAIWLPLVAVYMRGAAFLSRTESVLQGQLGGVVNADIERAFKDPPRSTEQILHPQKYWDSAALDLPLEVVIEAADLPAGWTLRHTDTLGELGLYLVSQPVSERKGLDTRNQMSVLGIGYSAPRSEGWGGDRFALLAGPEGASVLVSLSVWDTPKDAQEFSASLAQVGNQLGAQETGNGWGATWQQPDERSCLLLAWHGVDQQVAQSVRAGLRLRVLP